MSYELDYEMNLIKFNNAEHLYTNNTTDIEPINWLLNQERERMKYEKNPQKSKYIDFMYTAYEYDFGENLKKYIRGEKYNNKYKKEISFITKIPRCLQVIDIWVKTERVKKDVAALANQRLFEKLGFSVICETTKIKNSSINELLDSYKNMVCLMHLLSDKSTYLRDIILFTKNEISQKAFIGNDISDTSDTSDDEDVWSTQLDLHSVSSDDRTGRE